MRDRAFSGVPLSELVISKNLTVREQTDRKRRAVRDQSVHGLHMPNKRGREVHPRANLVQKKRASYQFRHSTVKVRTQH
jgi:hypothetical protein